MLRRPWVRIVLIIAVLVFVAIAAYGLSLAGQAGRLPWQEDPTRIPITPFEGIPGFDAPTPAGNLQVASPAP